MSTSKKEELAYMLSDAFPILHKKLCGNEALPIPVNHFSTLILLSVHGKLKISDISRGLGISKQQMSPIINRLNEACLIERIVDTKDRRNCYIDLTTNGTKLLDDHREEMVRNLKKRLSVLSEQDLDDFVNSLHLCFKLLQKL